MRAKNVAVVTAGTPARASRMCRLTELLFGNRDFDRPVVAAGRVLNIDPGAALVGRVEVEAREFRARRPVRCPPSDAFARIGQIAIAIQISRKPDIVVRAAVPILDDVVVVVM